MIWTWDGYNMVECPLYIRIVKGKAMTLWLLNVLKRDNFSMILENYLS